MAFKPLLYLTLWASAATCASAATSSLSNDITSFVPACAVDCFQSFISTNYDGAGCGSSPTLQCLCQKTGSSGFTIGEGGVQCLVAEINRKSCLGTDASQQAISKVYAMCSGVPNAAAETHATIVATLVVPSGTGPVQVPAATSASPVSSGQTTASTSSSPELSITPILTVSPPSSPTTTPSTSPITSSESSGAPKLNTAQIAGISIGIAATLGFAIGLIFLARCVRRRNFGDQESGLFKPKRESKGFGVLKSNQSSPRALQISAPIHKTPVEMNFRRPGDFHFQSPNNIGLALSPSQSMVSVGTAHKAPGQSPRGLKQPPKTYIPYTPGAQPYTTAAQGPPKPTLTLSIPQAPVPPPKDPRIPQSNRDSVMTEFQEDGEGESVVASNIWRPPPTDPQSATSYYVADKWGNWVLSNKGKNAKAAELPSPLNRTKAERAMDAMAGSSGDKPAGTASPPRELTPKAAQTGLAKPPIAALGSPFRFKDKDQASRSSSVYSNFSLPVSVAPGPENPLPSKIPAPDTYLSLMRQNGPAGTKAPEGNRRQKSKRGSRPNKRRSQDSTTTIASSVAEAYEEEDIIDADLQENLSPVVESPRTPLSPGVSPVSYPRIPTSGQEAAERRRQQEQQQQHFTPPKAPQPALSLFPRATKNELLQPPSLFHPAGQPSPTLGAVGVSPLKIQRNPAPAQLSGAAKQQFMRVPALNPNPIRNPGDIKTGSPEMRAGSAPPEGEKQRRPSPLHQHQRQSSGHHRRGSSLQLQYQQQEQQQPQDQTKCPQLQPLQGHDVPRASTSDPYLRVGNGLPDRIILSPASATTNGSVDSAGSSWLATKRLGADRAAALALGSDDITGQSARRVKWQREQGGGPGFVGQDTTQGLPATPGWLPKLTPTRRGDDLFLNVQ